MNFVTDLADDIFVSLSRPPAFCNPAEVMSSHPFVVPLQLLPRALGFRALPGVSGHTFGALQQAIAVTILNLFSLKLLQLVLRLFKII